MDPCRRSNAPDDQKIGTGTSRSRLPAFFPVTPFFDRTPAAPKICGITREEDALLAIGAGAGALGFNFHPSSPRALPEGADISWISRLKSAFPATALVAVVVNPGDGLLGRLREARYFDAVQFHGDETPEFCEAEGSLFPYWIKALRVRSRSDLDAAAPFRTPWLLLDASVPGAYGGTGHSVDWGLASSFVSGHPGRRVILAGGLTPENVAGAISRVRPHAVDVASGVESFPGVKDPEKVAMFLSAAAKEETPPSGRSAV